MLDAPADAYVLEISSFQMETTDSLAPLAATVLNVSPDHLDRHGTLERYAELKEKLLRAADHAVVNADDPIVAAMGARHPRAVPFSVATELARGYSIVERNGERWLARDREPLLRAAELAIRGTHNEANALAALALTAELTRDLPAALEVLRRFPGLPHRCQRVAVRKGVTYVDDSKGTNVGATLAALQGLDGPLVLIAGGLAKGQDLAPLAAGARGKLRAAVLIGTAAPELEQALAGGVPHGACREHGRRRRALGRARAPRRYGAAVARVREPGHVPRLQGARRFVRARGRGAAGMNAVVKPRERRVRSDAGGLRSSLARDRHDHGGSASISIADRRWASRCSISRGTSRASDDRVGRLRSRRCRCRPSSGTA